MSKTVEELQAEIDDMQAALTKANGEAADRRKTAKELKDKLASFEGIDIDEVKALKEKAIMLEQERLKEAGKFEEALEKGLAGAKAEIESLKGLISGKDSKLSKVLIDNAVLAAIDGKAINSEQVLALIRSDIKMDGDNPIVMNGEAPRVDDKGNHLTVADYAKAFLDSNPHLMNPSGGGSGSQGNQGGAKTSNTLTREEFSKLPAAAAAEHFKQGGKVVD